MNILSEILDARGGQVVQQMANQLGLHRDDVRDAVANMLPALTEGLKKNVSKSPQDREDLMAALERSQHSRYVDEPETLSEQRVKEDGNAILGHILGTKAVSRKVANQASSKTGIGPDVLKSMLPILAAVAMGALSKKTAGGPPNRDMDSLTSLIDLDGDGSVADDVLDFARKLF